MLLGFRGPGGNARMTRARTSTKNYLLGEPAEFAAASSVLTTQGQIFSGRCADSKGSNGSAGRVNGPAGLTVFW